MRAAAAAVAVIALLGGAVTARADSNTADAQVSVVAPPAPEGLNRFELKLRPFRGVVGSSWGGIGELRVEHYFRSPFMVGLELSPLALASAGEGVGAIAQARVHGAFVTRYLSVGLGLGGQLQRFGRNGLSVAPTLRLGSLDGLNFRIEYAYSVAANQYTGKRTIGFSNLLATLQVPLTRRLALELDGGLQLQSWAFATVGLRHRLYGEGGPGTWFVTGAFGGAWISDQGACNFASDAVSPCPASAHSFGPTVMFGLERRF
jgi:hypothetical protein